MNSCETGKPSLDYRPEYPLPGDFLAFDRQETLCQYCGVSYLIFTELKNMEKNVLKLTAEITLLKEKETMLVELSKEFEICTSKAIEMNAEIENWQAR